MNVILHIIFLLILIFLAFHTILFCAETRKKILNPRPCMFEIAPDFSDVEKKKTQKIYFVNAI